MTEQTVLVTPTNGATGFSTTISEPLTPTIARQLARHAGGWADVFGGDAQGNAVKYIVRKTVRKVIEMTADECAKQDAEDAIQMAKIEAERLEWLKQLEEEDARNAEEYAKAYEG